MMKLRALPYSAAALACLTVAFGATANPAAAGAGEGCLTVSIPVGAYDVMEADGGSEIILDGFGYVTTPGMPHLPARVFSVAIPPGAEFTGLEFDLGQGSVMPGEWRIPPARLPRVVGNENPTVYQMELARYEEIFNQVYQSDDAFPQQNVQFVRTAGYREYNLVDVMVTPFTYHPRSGQLAFHDDITVNIHYRQQDQQRVAGGGSARVRDLAQTIVLNHDQAQGWYQSTANGRGLHDFVIITPSDLTDDVQPLVDWEGAKGRTVEVVTTGYIESWYAGYDLAEKMRNFLRENYPWDVWGIEDVLLVGDYDDVPMRRCEQNTGYGKPETDFYYAELTKSDADSWDQDGDHLYGEDSDPIDFYGEVNVGRIPWSDSSTVRSICEKSVAYEQNTDPAFKQNMLLLGAYFWDDTDNAVLMETKIDQDWMTDWTFTRMYEQGHSSYQMDYPLSHSNVVSVWSSGTYAFVNWAGHGSPTSAHIYYSKGSAFIESGDCPQLNDDYPAIIFADACSNSDTDELNIGQSMLKQGAVGFLGATKVAYGMHAWNQPYSGSSQSLDYFFTTYVTSRDYSQGAAHQLALVEMYQYNMWYYDKYETFEWGALWGNPDLAMGQPAPLSIVFPEGRPELLAPGEDTTITVQIKDGAEDYVPGTGTIYYRYDGGTYNTADLALVSGDIYEATLPGADCDDLPEYYFSAEGDGGSVILSPFNAPDSVYDATVGVVIETFADNFEDDHGWTVVDESVDTGSWDREVPSGNGGDRGDPVEDYDGSGMCFVTGNDYDEDLDGGPTRLISPAFDMTGQDDAYVNYARWFYNDDQDIDNLLCEVSNDDGNTWTTLEDVSHSPSWTMSSFRVSDFVALTDQIRFRFSATDNPNDSVTEAGIDCFSISYFQCEDACPEDVDGNEVVDIDDLFEVLAHWGEGEGTYDVNSDGVVDIDDVFAILSAWGPCP